MSLPNRLLDYTDLDFDSLVVRLFNMVTAVFPHWTERKKINFGNTLMRSFAHVGDVLTRYQGHDAREARWAFAQLRRNLIALTKMIAYQPHGPSAATVDAQFTLATGIPANDVIIPAGTIARTSEVTDPLSFRLLADLTIPALTDPPVGVGTIENSEARQQLVTSTGEANQTFVLPDTPFIDDSAVVAFVDGAYTRVDNFLESTSTSQHFVVSLDQNDQATLKFGNGVTGKVPVGAGTIDYKTGGGAVGNVGPGTIIVLDGSFTDVLSNPVTITVTNPTDASGGNNRQSEAKIRELAPESLRTLNRVVSDDDYEVAARSVTGVSRALMLTADRDISVPENNGRLYVVPTGGGFPSTSIKNEVAALVDSETGDLPGMNTFSVQVLDPVYFTINVQATVFIRAGVDKAGAKAEIETRLSDFFDLDVSEELAARDDDLKAGESNPRIDFGYKLQDSTGTPTLLFPGSPVLNEIIDSPGVRSVQTSDFLLNGVVQDFVSIGVSEFPVLGTVTLLDGDTGLALGA